MDKQSILVIEDDATLLSTLIYNIGAAGYPVVAAGGAREAAACLFARDYGLVIMDINLPDGSGFDLCRDFRAKSSTPVIIITANDMEQDMLRGYELGADDYITKPFSVSVFIKKISALLKRAASGSADSFSDGFLDIVFSKAQARRNGEDIKPTPLEFRVLKTFIQNPGIVLTRRALLEKLWDSDQNYVDEHALTACISRLRGKIEKSGRKYIKTIYGMGYIWMGSEDG
jgi:DNA-binding response OmpR family regulator